MRNPDDDITPRQNHIDPSRANQRKDDDSGVKQRWLFGQVGIIVRWPIGFRRQDRFQILTARASVRFPGLWRRRWPEFALPPTTQA